MPRVAIASKPFGVFRSIYQDQEPPLMDRAVQLIAVSRETGAQGKCPLKKMHKSRNNNHRNSNHRVWAKQSFRKRLDALWQDLQADPPWKYEELSPVQLLERSEFHSYTPDSNDLARATWFWSRRPRFLQAASWIVWLTVALGLPFWLFLIPSIGVPLLILAPVIVNTEISRSVRWRRQYELSIDRLIRTSTNSHERTHPGSSKEPRN